MNSMMKLFLIMVLVFFEYSAQATTLSIRLVPVESNALHPTMGDILQFRSITTASTDGPVDGVVLWISLVEIDPGHEQPVDLEDWSAHKAVSASRLEPGEEFETIWPMRLIKAGDYRLVICAIARDQPPVFTSPTIKFHVSQKPVVESRRILPIAIGIPILLLGLLLYRHRQIDVV